MVPEAVTDIFGDVHHVFYERYSSVLDIKLYYGRKDDRLTTPALILTSPLKDALLRNEKRDKYSFGEYLSAWTIVRLRRKIKQNPYESLAEWANSSEPHKPREVLFPPGQTREEVEDFFGVQHIVAIARQTDNDMLVLFGIPKDDAKKGIYSRSFIITNEIAEFVHGNTDSDDTICSILRIGERTLRKIRLELGRKHSILQEANLWFAAHLEEIVSMTIEGFISRYKTEPPLKRPSAIRHSKQGLNLLKNFSKGNDHTSRTILFHIRANADKKNAVAISKLDDLLSRDKVRVCLKAYRILELAREHNHTIPHGYRRILKRIKA